MARRSETLILRSPTIGDVAEPLRRIVGLALLSAVAAPLVIASVRTIAARMPSAPRAVRVTGGLALAVAVLQLAMTGLGLLSLLTFIPILVALLIIGLVWLRYVPASSASAQHNEWPAGGPWRTGALAAMAALGTQWLWWTVLALRDGVQRSDSLTYHLPTALAFAQSGSVRTPVATTVGSPAGFYTNGMEVLHAMGIVLTRSDVLTCVTGLAFAAMAIAACWSIGARYERGWLAALLGCVALAAPAIVQTQAGSALVDVPSAALVLTACAVVLWSDLRDSRAMIAVALIAGASLASKLLVLPVVLALLAIAVSRAARRRLASGLALLALIETAPWLIRNWIKTGTPLPMANIPGLHHIHFEQVTTLGRSAGHYFWDAMRYPTVGSGLADAARSGLGLGWIVLALATLVALGWGLRSGRVLLPVVGVSAAALVEYLASPFGAGGPGEPPFLFAVNLRYAALALLLAGVVISCCAVSDTAVRTVGIAGLVTFAVTALPSSVFASSLSTYRLETWPSQHRWPGVCLAVMAALVATLVADQRWLSTARARTPRPHLTLAALGVLALLALGAARSQVTSRFPAPTDLAAVYRYVDTLDNQRISVMGVERTYPLAGRNLSNSISSIVNIDSFGVPSLPTTCAQLQRLIARANADIIVVRDDATKLFDSRACLAGDPRVRPIARSGDISVWRLLAVASAAKTTSQSGRDANTDSRSSRPAPEASVSEGGPQAAVDQTSDDQSSGVSGVDAPTSVPGQPDPAVP